MAAGEFGADDVGVFAKGSDRVGVEVETGGDDGKVIHHDWDWAGIRYLDEAKENMRSIQKSKKKSKRTSR